MSILVKMFELFQMFLQASLQVFAVVLIYVMVVRCFVDVFHMCFMFIVTCPRVSLTVGCVVKL